MTCCEISGNSVLLHFPFRMHKKIKIQLTIHSLVDNFAKQYNGLHDIKFYLINLCAKKAVMFFFKKLPFHFYLTFKSNQQVKVINFGQPDLLFVILYQLQVVVHVVKL